MIRWLRDQGVAISIGHSAATLVEAQAGYAAGATSTTHLFNAMSGVDHRAPGVAVAALLDDAAYVELIADGIHVHPALWALITRLKPPGRLLLVSDALAIAGTGDGHGAIGGLEIEVVGSRVTLAGTSTLAGSVLSLDAAVRNLVASGVRLPDAVAAASRNPLTLLGVLDRGRIDVGQRADLVEFDERAKPPASDASRPLVPGGTRVGHRGASRDGVAVTQDADRPRSPEGWHPQLMRPVAMSTSIEQNDAAARHAETELALASDA